MKTNGSLQNKQNENKNKQNENKNGQKVWLMSTLMS